MSVLQKTFVFPGKVFLTGEYAVLKGGKALLLSLPPVFQFKASERKNPAFSSGQALLNPVVFHKNSPAGRFLKKNSHLLSYSFLVCDPHKGRGGFGFSSAAFNFLYALNRQHQNKNRSLKVSLSFLRKLWCEYRSLPFEGHFSPSGADLVSQWFKGVCVFSPSPFYARQVSWPFFNLNLAVLKTGISFPTWRHLKQLKSLGSKALGDLKSAGKCAVQAVLKKDQLAFVQAVQKYAFYLNRHGFLHAKAQSLLTPLLKLPFVVGAKGSGAMGAEALCVWFDKQDKKKLFLELKNMGYTQMHNRGFEDFPQREHFSLWKKAKEG